MVGLLFTATKDGDRLTAVNPELAFTGVNPEAIGREGVGSIGGVGLSGVASTSLGVLCGADGGTLIVPLGSMCDVPLSSGMGFLAIGD